MPAAAPVLTYKFVWKPLRSSLEYSGTMCIKVQFFRLWCGRHLTAFSRIKLFPGYIHWMFWFTKSGGHRGFSFLTMDNIQQWQRAKSTVKKERDINFSTKSSIHRLERNTTTGLVFSVGQNFPKILFSSLMPLPTPIKPTAECNKLIFWKFSVS